MDTPTVAVDLPAGKECYYDEEAFELRANRAYNRDFREDLYVSHNNANSHLLAVTLTV
jgi:hypothetical protein